MAEIHLDDDDEDSSAMMEAMGFSGFGRAKKRKFNPNVDAVVAGELPPKPSADSSTGANNAPLGERRRMQLPPPSASLPARPSVAARGGNADEIDLDDDDGDDGGGAAVGGETGKGGGENGDTAGDGPDSRYIDTSRPSRDYLPEELENMEVGRKIANVTGAQTPGFLTHAADQVQQQPASRHAQMHSQHAGRGSKRAAERSVGTPWWEGYYDAKMNENPWEKLERQRGLEPRGVWSRRAVGAGPGTANFQTASAVEEAEGGPALDDVDSALPAASSIKGGEDT